MVTYEVIPVRSALNPVKGMAFRWSLNPYRGCRHACTYCYARPTHAYFQLNAGSDFSNIILIRREIVPTLRAEISRHRWKRELVAVGTATDPYQAAEGMWRLTRGFLATLAENGTPATIVTKGTIVVRDLDVLTDLQATAGVTVCLSIPTVNERIASQTEPGTPPPAQRLRALARLRGAGIHAGVLLEPLIQELTGDPGGIDDVVRAAADAGAALVQGIPLRLAPGVREYFLTRLADHRPALARAIGRDLGPNTTVRGSRERVRAALEAASIRYGVPTATALPEPTRPPSRQLALALV
ncbi:MAG: radical SAM protein [Chloroflexi bacterium]|nr:radical SAM protein [Chloroflexota bacterium]